MVRSFLFFLPDNLSFNKDVKILQSASSRRWTRLSTHRTSIIPALSDRSFHKVIVHFLPISIQDTCSVGSPPCYSYCRTSQHHPHCAERRVEPCIRLRAPYPSDHVFCQGQVLLEFHVTKRLCLPISKPSFRRLKP